MIVIDANIVFRAILGKRVLQLLEEYSARGVRFFAPDVAFDDARKYLPVLLRKRGRSEESLKTTLEYLRTIIEPVEFNIYKDHEKEARRRLKDRDEQDWPVLACSRLRMPNVDRRYGFLWNRRRSLDNEPHRNIPRSPSRATGFRRAVSGLFPAE
jgi:predicted nucleic acid-binding protein